MRRNTASKPRHDDSAPRVRRARWLHEHDDATGNVRREALNPRAVRFDAAYVDWSAVDADDRFEQ
jgi:hypothetical protein